jgi:hypothetical protein
MSQTLSPQAGAAALALALGAALSLALARRGRGSWARGRGTHAVTDPVGPVPCDHRSKNTVSRSPCMWMSK